MHQLITLEHYMGPHGIPALLIENAERTVDLVNKVCMLAEADGVLLQDNPATESAISGNGNGGIRPRDSSVGSAGSSHKDAQALDRYDPTRALMRWCLSNSYRLKELGLYMEHPQWTRSWCHFQTVPPKSGNRFFVPYDPAKTPPTCQALPEQEDSHVQAFIFGPPRGGMS